MLKKYLRVTASYAVLILFCIISIYPVSQVLTVSLRPADRLLSTSLEIIPENATLSNYTNLFVKTDFLLWMWNSLLITSCVTLTGVLLAATAGYGFSRYKFIGKKAAMQSMLVTQMFPATMLLLPMYIMLVNLGLINSYLGIMVMYSATALPFCVWQMKGFYDTIPSSLEEAGRIDGCSQFQTFYKIVLPLAAPALVITALFSFMSSWTEYVVAAQILQDTALWTLPIGLKSFESNMSTEWGLYGAASMLVTVPVVVLFLALSRYLVSGLTLGSVKG
ncbi:MAG: sugar ABC transporter permease [Bacteroidetes bacterium]|nr:sugar ABC transporter permease [Bacteroidota bacterium]